MTQTASQNRYAYCENDPVNFADPSGYSKSGGSSGGSSSSNSGGGRATDAYSSGDRFASAMGLDTRSGLPSYSAGMNMQNYSNSGGDSLIFVTKIVNGVSTTYMMVPANKYDYSKNPSAASFKTTYGGRSYISLPMASQSVPASTPNSTAMAHTNIQVTAQMAQLMVDQRLGEMGVVWAHVMSAYADDDDGDKPKYSMSAKHVVKQTTPLWESREILGLKIEAGVVYAVTTKEISTSQKEGMINLYSLTATSIKGDNIKTEQFYGVKAGSEYYVFNMMGGENSLRTTQGSPFVNGTINNAIAFKDGTYSQTIGGTVKGSNNDTVTGYLTVSADKNTLVAAAATAIVITYAPYAAPAIPAIVEIAKGATSQLGFG